jgi:hypothetical protein
MSNNNNKKLAQTIVEDGFFSGLASSLGLTGKAALGVGRDVRMAVAGAKGANLYKRVYRKVMLDWKKFAATLGADAKTEAAPTDENLLKFVLKYYKADASELLAEIKTDFARFADDKTDGDDSPDAVRNRSVERAMREHRKMMLVAEEFFKALAREIASDPKLALLFLGDKKARSDGGIGQASYTSVGVSSAARAGAYASTSSSPSSSRSDPEVNMRAFAKNLGDLGVRKSLFTNLAELRGYDLSEIHQRIKTFMDHEDATKIVAAMLAALRR